MYALQKLIIKCIVFQLQYMQISKEYLQNTANYMDRQTVHIYFF